MFKILRLSWKKFPRTKGSRIRTIILTRTKVCTGLYPGETSCTKVFRMFIFRAIWKCSGSSGVVLISNVSFREEWTSFTNNVDLVYTKLANIHFRAFWLATQARDIHYISRLVCKTQWTRARVMSFPAEFWPDEFYFLFLYIHIHTYTHTHVRTHTFIQKRTTQT